MENTRKKQNDYYHLYLLHDNSDASLEAAKDRVKNGNAVLLYPASDERSAPNKPRQYIARFIKKGAHISHQVAMGFQSIPAVKIFPCEVSAQPYASRLIKIALTNMQREAALNHIPTDIMRTNVLTLLNTASLAALANSSLDSRQRVQLTLEQSGVKKLFSHIINGEPDEVKKMLLAQPKLSLLKREPFHKNEAVIANKAGQLISVKEKTGLMLALGEEDTEIAAMFEDAILLVADKQEVQAQYHAQFPDEWKKKEEARWKPVFTALNHLTTAIREAKPDDITFSYDVENKLTVKKNSAVAARLAEFRLLLNEKLKETITIGKHFNSHLLLQAFQIYDDNENPYFSNQLISPDAILFWRQVIGSIQRLLPINYVQAFCNGLLETEERLRLNQPQGRSLKIGLYDAAQGTKIIINYYPLLETAGVGFDYAVYAASHAPGSALRSAGWFAGSEKVLTFISTKNNIYSRIYTSMQLP